MSEIIVYGYEDADGAEDTYTTTDPVIAQRRAAQYGLRVIAHTYEWADSEPVADWDYTGGAA